MTQVAVQHPRFGLRVGAIAVPVAKIVVKLIGTLFALSIVTFLATAVIPGDPAETALGKSATPAQLQQFRHDQGLDQPLRARYAQWAGDFVKGDWGTSITNQQPVAGQVVTPMRRTVTLALVAFAIGVSAALGLGLLTGRRAGSLLDRVVSVISLVLLSLPEFVVAITVLLVLAVRLRWFPVSSGGLSFGAQGLSATLDYYALPVLTLAMILIPYVARLMRANVREVERQPHIQAAELQGITGWRLSLRRIAPNAAKPLLSVLAINLAELVAGVVVVETVFGFPGAGALLVSSVQSQDIPTVQALTMLIGGMLILFNSLADVALIWMNPRLRGGAS